MKMHKKMVKLAEAHGLKLADIKQALADVRKEHYSHGVYEPMFPVTTRQINDDIRESVVKLREHPWFEHQDASEFSDKEKEHFAGLVERMKVDAATDLKDMLKKRKKAKVGDTLVVHGFNEYRFITFKDSSTYRLEKDGWVRIEYWSELDEKTPEESLFFPGIRQEVADKLGVPLTEDFHNLFVWVAAGYNEDEYLDQICRYH